MALDLYADGGRETIKPQEEYILQLAYNNPAFPMLASFWAAFYDSPQYTYQDCGLLAHEFICLADQHQTNTSTLKICVRLARFFSQAHHSKQSVRCVSD